MSDVLLEPSVAVFAPVGSEGGQRPSTLSTGPAILPGGLAPGQRWSVGRKTDAMTALYTKATMRQRRSGARKRLEERTQPIDATYRRTLARSDFISLTCTGAHSKPAFASLFARQCGHVGIDDDPTIEADLNRRAGCSTHCVTRWIGIGGSGWCSWAASDEHQTNLTSVRQRLNTPHQHFPVWPCFQTKFLKIAATLECFQA